MTRDEIDQMRTNLLALGTDLGGLAATMLDQLANDCDRWKLTLAQSEQLQASALAIHAQANSDATLYLKNAAETMNYP